MAIRERLEPIKWVFDLDEKKCMFSDPKPTDFSYSSFSGHLLTPFHSSHSSSHFRPLDVLSTPWMVPLAPFSLISTFFRSPASSRTGQYKTKFGTLCISGILLRRPHS